MAKSGTPVLEDPRTKPGLLGLFLVCSTLLLYLPVLHHQFITVWDDDVYITGNGHVRSGLTFSSLRWALVTLKPFYWQPLTWLSHMASYQLFGMNAGPHHYVNVVLHAINALLLFLLLNRATGALWRSFIVAALFAFHPTNVETVAWVAERNTVLNTMFSLLTVAAYGWYVARPEWKRYLSVLVAFLFALMSKPATVTLPLILLLLDYWPLNRVTNDQTPKPWGVLVLEKVPLFLLAFFVSAFTLAGESASGTVMPFSVLPMSTRLENAVISYVAYAGNILWPSGLSPFYPHPVMTLGTSLPLGQVLASLTVLSVITVLVIYLRNQKFAAFGWLFFLIALLPMIGIVQTGSQARQDHFTYIPAIGLFILIVWGIGTAIEGARIPKAAVAFACLAVLASYAAVTSQYLRFWKNGVTLFARARDVAGQPNSWLEQLYANALFEAGAVDDALMHYQEACSLAPSNEYCHYNAAQIQFERHQFRAAFDEYQLALKYTANKEVALSCLTQSAEALLQMHQYKAAQTEIENALQIDPLNPTALDLRSRLALPAR